MVTALALGAAFCYALSAALQHSVAAARGEVAARGFLLALFSRPLWLLGNVLNAVGWGLQAAALGQGELIYVQPLLLLSVVLSLPMTALIRCEMPGLREWLGSAVVVSGVLLFVLGTQPAPSDARPTDAAWLGTVAGLSVAAAVFVGIGRRVLRPTMYAVAAGLLFGLAAALTKATVDCGWQFPVRWPFYVLLAVTGAAFYWMQRAFQSGRLSMSFPVIIALDPIVSVLLGLWLFGERIRDDTVSVAMACGGAAVTLAGIAILAGSRFVAEPQEAGRATEKLVGGEGTD